MSKKGKRSKWQWFFIGLGLLGFLVILYTGQEVVKDTIETLKGIDKRFLLILPVIQFVAYLFIAGYYKSALAIFDHKIPYLRAYGTVVSLYFVEQVLPSGGVSGMSYIAYALRTVASVGLTTIVQISRYLLNYAAYIIIVPVGIAFLLLSDPINTKAIWIAVSLLAGLVIGGFIIKYLLEAQNHVNTFVEYVSRIVNKIAKKLFKREQLLKPGVIKSNLSDFHEGASKLLINRTKIIRPYLFMVGASTMQLTMVYLSFIAVGEQINPGLVIIAFTVANIVGAISIIPGDVGVHEATMVFVLSTAGVDTAVALSATLLYRVYVKLIVLPIGFTVYTQFLKPKKEAIVDAK